MSISFEKGSFYLTSFDGKSVPLADNISFTMDSGISASEVVPILYNANQSAEISCEIGSMDLEFLNNMCMFPTPSSMFTLQYSRDILIQKRWHKKARINKKWLKRYGMKHDTVMVLADGVSTTWDKSDGSFEFESSNHRYILRSDQQRRGVKIVW